MRRYVCSIIAAVLMTVLVSIGAFAGATDLFAQAGKFREETVIAEMGLKLSPISIYDEENLLKITIEDVAKYHGDLCPCAIAGFRAIQFAISQLWQDDIPKRKDFKIISAFPGQGSQDAFEFITRVKTRGDFSLQLLAETDIANISIDNWVFIFIQKSTGKKIRVCLKGEVFPGGAEEYYRLRKKLIFEKTATPKEKEAFESAKLELKRRFMELLLDQIFDFDASRRSDSMMNINEKVN